MPRAGQPDGARLSSQHTASRSAVPRGRAAWQVLITTGTEDSRRRPENARALGIVRSADTEEMLIIAGGLRGL